MLRRRSHPATPIRRLTGLALITAGLILGLGRAPIARAAVLTVTTVTDELNADGDCSLREAVVAANTNAAVDACGAGSGVDQIVLPAGTYLLALAGTGEDAAALGDLDLLEAVTFAGAGIDQTIIDGNGSDRVLHVMANGVVLNALTIRNGNSGSNNAAGIQIVNGSVTGAQISVSDNIGNIGGIHVGSHSSLTLRDSTISNNLGASAGGIFVPDGSTAVIESSLIYSNSVSFDGGGIVSSGDVTLVNTTVSGNTANTDGGGLVFTDGVARLFNATVTANAADNSGSGGDGGGIWVGATAVVTATNTLLAGNVDLSAGGSGQPDCTGPVLSGGYSLIQSTVGCTWTAGAGDQLGVDPLLAPLAANGGPTRTQAPALGSPAIDAGDPTGCRDASLNRLWIDQRGFARITRCDIGAFETGSAGDPRWLWLPNVANSAAP